MAWASGPAASTSGIFLDLCPTSAKAYTEQKILIFENVQR
jgi:hypothetical protein